MSLTDLFNQADALYQFLLKSKGPQGGWSVIVEASLYIPWNASYLDAPVGQLTYSPYRVDVSTINEGQFKLPFVHILPASFSGGINALEAPGLINPYSDQPGPIEYVLSSVTISASSPLQPNMYTMDYASNGQNINTGPFPDSSPYVTAMESKLYAFSQARNFAIVFYGLPAEYPPPKIIITGAEQRQLEPLA
jgi:hypothetical protein